MEQRVQELSGLLGLRGYDVTVLTSNIGRSRPGPWRDGPVLVKSLRTIEIAHTPVMPGLFHELVRLKKNAIVHLHLAQAFVPEAVLLASSLKQFTYIVHVRIVAGRSGPLGVLLPAYQRLVLPRVLKQARHVIVLTDDYKDRMISEFGIPPGRVTVIPNATTFSRADGPKRCPSSQSTIRLLSVGRYNVQKNYPLLIEASALLAKRGVAFELSIVGEGEDQHQLAKLVEQLSLAGAVRLLPPAYGLDLERHYDDADLFMLSSSYETFGTVLIEAMAKGLPIIASNVPGIRNVVADGRNGRLVAQTPDAFADAVQSLVRDNELYASMSNYNLQDVRRYRWDNVVDMTCAVYNHVSE